MESIMSTQFVLPKIIGHRGAKGTAPENTLVSFKKAFELGATWVELDAKETKDGILIVMHDDDLDRTTNGKGKVTETNWSVIQGLDAGSWFSKEFAGEKVPTLDQSVQFFSTINLGVNIEIKPCAGKEVSTAKLVADFIKNNWPKSLTPPLVSSFSMKSLEVAKKENPNLIIGALFENELPANWNEIAKKVHATTINIDNDILNKIMVENIKNEGYKVLVYTVNSKERANELFSWGVTSIFTDYPYKL